MSISLLDLAALDLSNKSSQSATLQLEHPVTGEELTIVSPTTGEETPVTITLVGMDSETYRHAQNAVANRRINGRRKKISVEELNRESIEILARCTLGWQGIVVDGQELAPDVENAVKLYTRFPWIKEQADAFASDRANYLQD